MKKVISLVCAFAFALSFAGCNYLDIVPDDDIKTIETIFEERTEANVWVATCYRNMASLASLSTNVAFTGADELVGNDNQREITGLNGAIEGLKIGDGLQSALNPISDSWTNTGYYATIRYCNTFFEHIDKTLNMSQEEKDLWTAEVKSVKAFYYFQLVRKYGPIILCDHTISVREDSEHMKMPRVHVDTCFKEIVRLLDEAIPDLPLKVEKEAMRQGYFFKESALALKAMVLVYQASPLFNGNPNYANFKERNGELLFSTSVDKEKWRVAAEACDEAIRVCENAGWHLTQGYSGKSTQLLNTMMDIEQSVQAPGSVSSEIILQAKTQHTSYYSDIFFYGRILPYFCNSIQLNNPPSDGSLSPSMKMVEMYYTKNGLPIDMDPQWPYEQRYRLGQETDEAYYYHVVPTDEQVLNLHLQREPRFYACIASDRTYWRGYVQNQAEETREPFLVEARKGETFGTNLNSLQSRMNQNRSGYWLMKHIYTDLMVDNYIGQVGSKGDLPVPLIRLAQLYLMSSEAWNEYLDDKNDPRIFEGINKVRNRAGIPDVKTAWEGSNNPSMITTTAGLREIIHRETTIELAFEGQRFWDLRRWLEADLVLNDPLYGWNVVASDAEGFYNNFDGPIVVWALRNFTSPRDYFFPISSEEVMRSGIVQNPGW